MVSFSGPDATPSSSLLLSTASLPARDRLPVWREAFGQAMVRLEIEPAQGMPFHAEGELCSLPGAALASVGVTPFRVSRTRQLIARDVTDMVFAITADVPLRIVHNGREEFLDAGDAVFLRGSEESVIQARDRARLTNISVPMDDLAPLIEGRRDVPMTVVSRQNALLDLLLRYAQILQGRHRPLSGEAGHLAAAHLRDLIAAMLGSGPECGTQAPERSGIRAARLRAIQADTGARICDPALSVDTIAIRHGISPRYVRKLFQQEGTTFSDFVLTQRLERSRQMLRAKPLATIASIAHACGFNDVSYFNRTFRRRYGITPSDSRDRGG